VVDLAVRPAREWVKKGLPLCLIGDSGTSKSHLLIALGTDETMGVRLGELLPACSCPPSATPICELAAASVARRVTVPQSASPLLRC
jgi:hypothetical protein